MLKIQIIDHIKQILDIEEKNVKDDRNDSIKRNPQFGDFMKEYKLVMSNLAFSYKKIKNYSDSIVWDHKVNPIEVNNR
jgi:hypothetical protein